MKHLTEDQINAIIEALPHGSGIDLNWRYSKTRNNHIFANAYHCMDQNGYYDGWADFYIAIPRGTPIADWPTEFDLHFSGQYSQYLNQKHYLREYLEDTIFWSLRDYVKALADLEVA